MRYRETDGISKFFKSLSCMLLQEWGNRNTQLHTDTHTHHILGKKLLYELYIGYTFIHTYIYKKRSQNQVKMKVSEGNPRKEVHARTHTHTRC